MAYDPINVRKQQASAYADKLYDKKDAAPLVKALETSYVTKSELAGTGEFFGKLRTLCHDQGHPVFGSSSASRNKVYELFSSVNDRTTTAKAKEIATQIRDIIKQHGGEFEDYERVPLDHLADSLANAAWVFETAEKRVSARSPLAKALSSLW